MNNMFSNARYEGQLGPMQKQPVVTALQRHIAAENSKLMQEMVQQASGDQIMQQGSKATNSVWSTYSHAVSKVKRGTDGGKAHMFGICFAMSGGELVIG
jgi:pyruvate-formate lyase